ncbi:MAG TPA: sulfur carrier protein ThiS, partial [Micromonosporaceae bacterium]
MHVTINGEPHEIADDATLADLVAARLRSDKGVAAAVDGEVAPRGSWTSVALRDGQAIELLTAV